jgi:hypothetical protein
MKCVLGKLCSCCIEFQQKKNASVEVAGREQKYFIKGKVCFLIDFPPSTFAQCVLKTYIIM